MIIIPLQLQNWLTVLLSLMSTCMVLLATQSIITKRIPREVDMTIRLLNIIIDNVNLLSSPQLNTSVASVVYKGKGKPMFHHKSHRLVRVTPLFSRLIDEIMRPALVKIVRPIKNTNQYGFTEGVSYLMGALQRHEVEKYCVDMKKTFFGCSLGTVPSSS